MRACSFSCASCWPLASLFCMAMPSGSDAVSIGAPLAFTSSYSPFSSGGTTCLVCFGGGLMTGGAASGAAAILGTAGISGATSAGGAIAGAASPCWGKRGLDGGGNSFDLRGGIARHEEDRRGDRRQQHEKAQRHTLRAKGEDRTPTASFRRHILAGSPRVRRRAGRYARWRCPACSPLSAWRGAHRR